MGIQHAYSPTAAFVQNALPKAHPFGRVLDIGCADGATLLHPYYADCTERFGIDPDAEAVTTGQKNLKLKLVVGSAEELPYPDASFDFVISKGSLFFTDIPKSLKECYRVLKPRGDLFLTMHDWRHQWTHFSRAVAQGKVKRVVDHAYILAATIAYKRTGNVPRRPWNGRRETFQSVASVRRDLERAGFGAIEFRRSDRDFMIDAKKM